MGQKLYSYYVESAKLGGINARTRFSILTRMTSVQAMGVRDTHELLGEFDIAFKIVEKEFNQDNDVKENTLVENNPSSFTISLLRNQISVMSDLLASRSLNQNDLKRSLERITETVAGAIDVERASIWFYDEEKTQIECFDLYEKSKGSHSRGFILKKVDYPNYFKTMEREKTLAADDAYTHMGTKEFSESYLKSFGITSMLDAPIWVGRDMVGVLCQEHVGEKRNWNRDEENFVYLMSNITAILAENKNYQSMII